MTSYSIVLGAMVISLALAAAPAFAAKGGASEADPDFAAWQRCIDKSDGTNFAWDQCGGTLVKAEEARLNDAWRRIYPKLEPKSKTALLTEQRAWLAFKDGSCDYFASGDYGREGQVMHWALCRAKIISDRTDDLHGLYDQTFQDEQH